MDAIEGEWSGDGGHIVCSCVSRYLHPGIQAVEFAAERRYGSVAGVDHSVRTQ